MQLNSADQSHFAQIPQINRPRSTFKRVSRHKHTFDEGLLVPIYLDDVLPGDTFNVKANMFARLATPIFPLMDNMYLETFWFFVPNRLVWDNFTKQHGERVDPDDSIDFTTPYIDNTTLGGVTVGDLWDNFGLPMQNRNVIANCSALPFRMYNMIWNEWFRDQDLQDSLPVPKGNGPDSYSANYALRRIGKYKDYFTTMRPAPQKGPAVQLPIGGTAPVTGPGGNYGITVDAVKDLFSTADYGNIQLNAQSFTGGLGYLLKAQNPPAGTGTLDVEFTGNFNNGIAPGDDINADLSEAVGPTVNAWREAITIQQMYELDMRGGTRFIEMIYNHYGVVNPDFRLQRPEFLGYKKSHVNIHPVQQTSESNETPQGNLAAFGTVSSSGNGFVKTFTEFGYIMGLIAVRADLSYQEGLDRHWSRKTRFDYYYPIFANLGEQAVLNQEWWMSNSADINDNVAGYQERWAEYRFKTSKVTGLFRSSAAQSLDAWHLAQEFDTLPTLSAAFIQEDAPVDRTIAVPSEPHFIFDSVVTNISARPMPVYSTPGLTRL